MRYRISLANQGGNHVGRHRHPSPAPSLTNLNLQHLELMHHYITNTSLTLQEAGDTSRRWDVTVPSEALSHDFLMHALLGVSALHIVRLRGLSGSTSQYLRLAQVHHHHAFTLFRSTFTRITPENCTAALAFSSLALIFSSGVALISDGIPYHSEIDTYIALLKSFRGFWSLFVAVRSRIADGPMGRFPPLRMLRVDESMDEMANAAAEAVRLLLDLNSACVESERDKAVYHGAILQIQGSLHRSSALPRMLWPVFISDAYVAHLEQKRPMALVILAHSCVLAKYAPYRWFLHDWIIRITIAIEKTIGPAWEQAMRWPLDEWGLTPQETEGS